MWGCGCVGLRAAGHGVDTHNAATVACVLWHQLYVAHLHLVENVVQRISIAHTGFNSVPCACMASLPGRLFFQVRL